MSSFSFNRLKTSLGFNEANEQIYGDPNTHVHSEVLVEIDDPLDALQIWSKPGPFQRNANRLKGILESCAVKDEGQEHVHAHLIIEIPAEQMDRDQIFNNGKRCDALVRDLVELHRKDFGKRMLQGTTPRVKIVATKGLANNSVRIRIGRLVYVPAADEPQAWKIEGSRDGGYIFKDLGELSQMQRLALLGSNSDTAAIQAWNWPFGTRLSIILVNDPHAESLAFSADPYGCLEVTYDKAMGHYVVKGGGKDEQYILRFTRLTPPLVKQAREAARPARSLVETRPGKADVTLPDGDDLPDPLSTKKASVLRFYRLEEDFSVLPQHDQHDTCEPDSGQEGTIVPLVEKGGDHAMKLVGIAMPRISLYKSHGVKSMGFGLNRQGRIVSPHDPQAFASFHVDDSDRLLVRTRDGTRLIQAGDRLPAPNGEQIVFDTVAEAMRERYAAFCRLPSPLVESIHQGACFPVGRATPVMKSIRPLAGRGFIDADVRWASADRMGLSRKAFGIEVSKEGLEVSLINDQQAIYHLDATYDFIGQMDPAQRKTYTVLAGQHLVAGVYVWRYEV